MKALLLITLLVGYIYPCIAQEEIIELEESLSNKVIYDKTTTFETEGYTYLCDVDDGSQFVTLYNKENKLTYENIVYKATGKYYIGDWNCNVIESDELMNLRDLPTSSNSFAFSRHLLKVQKRNLNQLTGEYRL